MPKEKKIRPPQHQRKQPGRQHKMRPQPRSGARDYAGCGKLRDKVALITGGDSGIGRAVGVLFAKEGADVTIVYLNEHRDARQTKRLERTFRTNIFSMFFMTKAAMPHFRKGGNIINTTSVTAYQGSPELLDYSSTKGAIVAFTRSLSQALAEKKIRVNAVAPGPIWTPLIPSTFPAKEVATFGSDTPLGRAGEPEEVATCFVFLASDDSSYITGQVLHPNGGRVVNG